MADSARARRLAKRIVTIVATELQHQVKDPRLAMVTVTAATVTPDLREATVFYTVYGDRVTSTARRSRCTARPGCCAPRSGAQTGIKFTPTLVFKLDTVPENAYRINELLAAARSADAEVAERAAGASYAGEPDPYKAPRVEDTRPDDADDDDPGDAEPRRKHRRPQRVRRPDCGSPAPGTVTMRRHGPLNRSQLAERTSTWSPNGDTIARSPGPAGKRDREAT